MNAVLNVVVFQNRFFSGYSGGLAAIMLSGALSFAAFPAYDFAELAWISLVPFIITALFVRPLYAFILGFIWGVVFYTGIFFWMFDLPDYRVLHHAVLGIYLCPLTGAFGCLVSLIARRKGIPFALLAAPLIWVSFEFIRSNLSFLSLPWAILAHSQYRFPLLIQSASILGTYGISFAIVLVNSGVAAICLLLLFRKGQEGTRRGMGKVIYTALSVVTIILVFGFVYLDQPNEGPPLKISVVQANIAQDKKWDPQFASTIMSTYHRLTREAAASDPDLIVWPETATPKAINYDPALMKQVAEIAAGVDTTLLLGSSNLHKFKPAEPESAKYKNSAFLIDPKRKGQPEKPYDKIRLLPFGEYLPHGDKIPWTLLGIPAAPNFLPGEEIRLFRLKKIPFGVPICWENIFDADARRFVDKGAEFLVNITNEAWFGHSAAPYQFLSMNIFRAVENNRYVVRCANTGVSCLIDSRGRILNRVRDQDNNDVNVEGVLTGVVFPSSSKTVFNRYGNWFAWLCVSGTCLITAWVVLYAYFSNRSGAMD